ncbi:HAAS signaling domain-containing protein [Rummeliibacillus sp. NPDC094406]|uniref:HAAS signaling domain-containing protein n=1 Tax=Rummeliibacillus sp. NPDC094406 TaxID=3364511 RepID=UPI0037FA6C4E
MTKEQFLKNLNLALEGLSSVERQDILEDYEEHFAIGLEEGKTEEQIASSLGTPHHIAKELLANYHLEKVETTNTTGNIFRAVWAAIGLGFFNLVIVLGPFIGLLGVVFAGWVAGVSFIVSPLLVLVNTVNGTFEIFDLFASIGLCGLGLFIILGMFFVTKWLTKGFVKYLKFNVSLVKGGLKA